MIKIENTQVTGFVPALHGMRNPKNSWERSDSHVDTFGNCEVGENDKKLCTALINGGVEHRKFLRMIVVYMDVTALLYWWKEMDTYTVGKVQNGCSTMHKLDSRDLTEEDFSCEHLNPILGLPALHNTIYAINWYRKQFKETGNKEDWWQMIQLLPTSYNQKRTLMVNYEVLRKIYHERKNHKLDEWHEVCRWIESLPNAWMVVGE